MYVLDAYPNRSSLSNLVDCSTNLIMWLSLLLMSSSIVRMGLPKILILVVISWMHSHRKCCDVSASPGQCSQSCVSNLELFATVWKYASGLCPDSSHVSHLM